LSPAAFKVSNVPLARSIAGLLPGSPRKEDDAGTVWELFDHVLSHGNAASHVIGADMSYRLSRPGNVPVDSYDRNLSSEHLVGSRSERVDIIRYKNDPLDPLSHGCPYFTRLGRRFALSISDCQLDAQLFGFVLCLCFHESEEWEGEVGNDDDNAFILSLG
jgi:hypothetical protein